MSNERFNPSKQQRDRAFATAMKRKEEYLGARVPKELRDRVIAKAKEQGIPVSILIRNILEDAFNDVSDGSSRKPLNMEEMVESSVLDSVLAWDKISLNKGVNCVKCGKVLAEGDMAFLGLGGAIPVVICPDCG